MELGAELGFERDALRERLMAGSAQSFALRVAPGFVTPERAGPMRDLLGKDVALARDLAAADHPSLKPLLAAAQSMLDLLEAVESRPLSP
jgi:3-hydroxyisobutyrate dehydrogenase-like beta-hydroxyacid dehydrogenase